MSQLPRGYVLYDGPSALDPDARIVAILTRRSGNRKTGRMHQIWILRADRSPLQAIADGSDRAICGSCPARGLFADDNRQAIDWDQFGAMHGRYCYVDVGRAPESVYWTWIRGRYLEADPRDIAPQLTLPVRLGAYGDPAAVPVQIWRDLLRYSPRWTGYTHQWRTCDPAFRSILMASCETEQDHRDAIATGWRTFRVRRGKDPVLPGEIICPASEESKRTTCAKCTLCNGSTGPQDRRRNIVIQVHGANRGAFVTLQALRQSRVAVGA
jgi:hypothetical protein